MSREANFYEKEAEGNVRCHLCHHFCHITPGHRGICAVRENVDGKLISLVYGHLIARHLDPIEKKPLNHFLPGSMSYSIATVGCNFKCRHCQNADISQVEPGEVIQGSVVEPNEVVADALYSRARSISYTYTEPTVFLEYALDVAGLAREAGLKNVLVSNGYMSQEAAMSSATLVDAINIDLKGDDQFYREICRAKVDPVKENIRLFWEQGVWVEVTTLVIPGYNDQPGILREIAEFLSSISPDLPWHVSAFYPTYKLRDAPPTRAEHLLRAMKIGRDAGLRYIYAGNIPGEGENTFCHSCGHMLVERLGLQLVKNRMVQGRCPNCGTTIPGVW